MSQRPAWAQRIVDQCSHHIGEPEFPLLPGDHVKLSATTQREWGFSTPYGVMHSAGLRNVGSCVHIEGIAAWVDLAELTLVERCV